MLGLILSELSELSVVMCKQQLTFWRDTSADDELWSLKLGTTCLVRFLQSCLDAFRKQLIFFKSSVENFLKINTSSCLCWKI